MKKVENRWLTVLAALLGLAATPVVFLEAFCSAFVLMAAVGRTTHLAVYLLPALGTVAFGIWWSIFAAFRWKTGNIGIRIGLTAIAWAVITAVLLASFIVPMRGGL